MVNGGHACNILGKCFAGGVSIVSVRDRSNKMRFAETETSVTPIVSDLALGHVITAEQDLTYNRRANI